MQTGDVITPYVSRFPLVDRDGRQTFIDDDAIGQLALVLTVGRHYAEVAFIDNGKTAIYRLDEVELVYDKETWLAQIETATA